MLMLAYVIVYHILLNAASVPKKHMSDNPMVDPGSIPGKLLINDDLYTHSDVPILMSYYKINSSWSN
jgi:hypothetical protein